MALFDGLFYSGPMLAVFSDESRLQRMLDFESALASAEAALRVIPAGAAETIAHECRIDILNFDALKEGAARAGNLAIPMVKQLIEAVREKDPKAAGFVHWGATSQDAIDTGFILQVRDALNLLEDQLRKLCGQLAVIAERHAATLMPGRTWLQQAVPVTFGWKVAGWMDAMLRHQVRLREARGRVLTLQFGGAAGTLASLGKKGWAVSQKLASTLDLAHPDVCWHASRDRVGEVASVLGLITATLGKIARDISLLMQTEVGEAFEPAGEGRGGSSTMPQKRNPVACAAVLAAAVRVPGLVATTLTSMVQEHERGLGNWQAEWETVPEIFNLCSGALERMGELIAGLQVDSARMAANLDLTHGLVLAEAVAMELASRIGKSAAHEVVERACRVAVQEKRHLRKALMDDGEVSKLITEEELDRLFDPAQYLGTLRRSIDQVLARGSAAIAGTQRTWMELADVRVHYQWSGLADKPVLVLSNSLGTDLNLWDGQISEFSKHFHILRYDSRGHGLSSAPKGPYSIEQLSRDLVALLDGLGVESCCFCGLSIGGMIGQWLGVNARSRVRKLVLCNTAAKIGTAESWNARIDAVLEKGMEAVSSDILNRWYTPAFRTNTPEIIARSRRMLEGADLAGYVACCAAIRDADQRDAVRRINVPTLIVAGTHDRATTPAEGRSLAESIAGAQYVELNSSHLSNVEAEEAFTSAVLEFLQS